jgi:cytidylate kinase
MLLLLKFNAPTHLQNEYGLDHATAKIETTQRGETSAMTHTTAKPKTKKKIVICICGMAGSGKSTVAKRLAERYGLKYYSGGDALKAVAADMGYRTSGEGWWETEEGIRFLKKREESLDIDRKVDEKLLEWAKPGGVVLDSWAMPWLLKKGFKIWLEASEKTRVQRMAERDSLGPQKTLRFLREKEARTKAIYRQLYGFKIGEDLSPFHLILDVNTLGKDEVFEALRMAIDNHVLANLDAYA